MTCDDKYKPRFPAAAAKLRVPEKPGAALAAPPKGTRHRSAPSSGSSLLPPSSHRRKETNDSARGRSHFLKRDTSFSAASCEMPSRIACSSFLARSAIAAACADSRDCARSPTRKKSRPESSGQLWCRDKRSALCSTRTRGASSAELRKGCRMQRRIHGARLLRKSGAVKMIHEHLHQCGAVQVR
jgi:hypothetical protein